MLISGIKKTTLLDYPGKVATIIFTLGCNLRCGFCHNPEFVLPNEVEKRMDDLIPEENFFAFLEERKSFIDGVVICGGEPTLHKDLPEFAKKIKDLGLLIKLDTNGSNSTMLRYLIQEKLVDYIAMDIKHTFEQYGKITNVSIPIKQYSESISLIIRSQMEYEFRTTVIQGVHTPDDIAVIAQNIHGAKKYILQNFRTGKILDPHFYGKSFSHDDLIQLRNAASPFVEFCSIRP
ncbi:MAG: anaerobic ribonucleoside-triphosphate reductase activating protein [Candidatus Gracilibacteria bacterium]